jgi:hypothetical protein
MKEASDHTHEADDDYTGGFPMAAQAETHGGDSGAWYETREQSGEKGRG